MSGVILVTLPVCLVLLYLHPPPPALPHFTLRSPLRMGFPQLWPAPESSPTWQAGVR